MDIAKTVVHYGWYVGPLMLPLANLNRVPFVIYVGFVSSQQRPNLFKYVNAIVF